MSINVRLTNSQFYDMFGDSLFVRPMSFSAVDSVLDFIEECSEDPLNEVIDWHTIFKNANEYSLQEFINKFHHYIGFDTGFEDNEDLALSIIENMEVNVRAIFDMDEIRYVVID